MSSARERPENSVALQDNRADGARESAVRAEAMPRAMRARSAVDPESSAVDARKRVRRAGAMRSAAVRGTRAVHPVRCVALLLLTFLRVTEETAAEMAVTVDHRCPSCQSIPLGCVRERAMRA